MDIRNFGGVSKYIPAAAKLGREGPDKEACKERYFLILESHRKQNAIELRTSRLKYTGRIRTHRGSLCIRISKISLETGERKDTAYDTSVVGKEKRAHAA